MTAEPESAHERFNALASYVLAATEKRETRAHVKITPREKGETPFSLSHRRVSPFSRWVIFTPARASLALVSLWKNWD